MKKTHLYHIVDVSPWPLASSIGALLLTSGFAWNNHRNNYNMIINCFDLKLKKRENVINVVEVISEVVKVLRSFIEVSIKSQMILFIGESTIVRRIWSKKKILRRFYSESHLYNKNTDDDNKFINLIHKHQAITIGEAVNNTKKELSFNEAIFNVFTTTHDFTYKVGVEKQVAKDLNNVVLKELVLKKQFEKGEISNNNYLFLNEINKNFNVSKGFKLKSGEKIKFAHVTNLTRSPKNASNIIERGQVRGVLEKGLYSYNNQSLIFLLHNEEVIKKAIYFLAYYYEKDKYNNSILENLGKQEKMDFVIEKNIEDRIKIFALEAILFESLWKNNKTVLNYLTELLKKKKW